MKKNIRVWGTYYTETDKGRRYIADYDETIVLETDLEAGWLKSFIQKQVIEKHLIAKFGRDRFFGWQTCDCQELATPVAPATPAPKAPKAKKSATQVAPVSAPVPVESDIDKDLVIE